ncbi:MAG: Pr6Pr family membrane protein [Eubacteriales bacterium]
MCIRNKKASLIWKAVFLLLVAWALLDGSGILAGHYRSNFPHMFTNISNIAAWVYFLCAFVKLKRQRDQVSSAPFSPVFKYTATISLLVTMIIAHFMVFDAMFQNGKLVWHLVVMHYVAPCMALLDWLLFDEKGKMPVWGPLAWVSLAVAYLAFTMIAVGVFGVYMGGGTTADITPYPYDFLDPSIVGKGAVIGFCGGMIAAFIALGYVLFGLDRLMGRRNRTGATGKGS